MFLRIRVDAILDPKDEDIKGEILKALGKVKHRFQRLNEFETSSIVVEECYHDEAPVKPCKVVFEWRKE